MSNAVATKTKNDVSITESVASRLRVFQEKGEIAFPKNYNYENALKSAWLNLQNVTVKVGSEYKPALEQCSKTSIANALLDMAVQGLSPAKKQCYFVGFGKELQLIRSYFGSIAAVKRLKNVKNVIANCIYENDIFEYEFDLDTGIKRITKHEQKFENIDINKITGAYAIISTTDDIPNYVEIMNINQIKNSWGQGYAKGNSGAHKNFTDQMVLKTVINRACKIFANTSDDSDLLIESFNRSTENEHKQEPSVEEEVKQEIEQKANKEVIDFEEDNVIDIPTTENKETIENGPDF